MTRTGVERGIPLIIARIHRFFWHTVGMKPFALDAVHGGLTMAVCFLSVGWLWAKAQAKKSALRAAVLEEELRLLKSQPKEWELRVDRFDLLWFPLLKTDGQKVVSLSVGVPHCRTCVQPLSLSDKQGWKCAGCGAFHPESLADLMVTDSVGGEALKQFLLKHSDYRGALK